MRDDSGLYSGITSNTSTKLAKAKLDREERDRAKTEKRKKLTPYADVVIEELDKEKEATQSNLMSLIGVKTPEEGVKDIIVALNLYGESISKLRSRLSNIMREKK